MFLYKSAEIVKSIIINIYCNAGNLSVLETNLLSSLHKPGPVFRLLRHLVFLAVLLSCLLLPQHHHPGIIQFEYK